jgi:hypothetical protein
MTYRTRTRVISAATSSRGENVSGSPWEQTSGRRVRRDGLLVLLFESEAMRKRDPSRSKPRILIVRGPASGCRGPPLVHARDDDDIPPDSRKVPPCLGIPFAHEIPQPHSVPGHWRCRFLFDQLVCEHKQGRGQPRDLSETSEVQW